jgi:hypothetical protein
MLDNPKNTQVFKTWEIVGKTTLTNMVSHVEKKKPTRCHLMLYFSYELLYMFRALICPSSGA